MGTPGKAGPPPAHFKGHKTDEVLPGDPGAMGMKGEPGRDGRQGVPGEDGENVSGQSYLPLL